MSAKPNIVIICLGVETESENVTQALNENSEVNEIKIKTGDLSEIGKIISVTISSGANRVEWIEFELSEDKIKALRAKAIIEACEDAKLKATVPAVATPPIKPGEVTVSFRIVATFTAQ